MPRADISILIELTVAWLPSQLDYTLVLLAFVYPGESGSLFRLASSVGQGSLQFDLIALLLVLYHGDILDDVRLPELDVQKLPMIGAVYMQEGHYCNAYIIHHAPEASRKSRIQCHLLPEPFSDNPGTSVYPKFHIPHKLVGTANQAHSTRFYKNYAANLRSTISNETSKLERTSQRS